MTDTGRLTGTLAALAACVVILAPWSAAAAADAEATPGVYGLRVGFASSMFTDVNEMDAKAGVKVWASTVAKERGIAVDPDPQLFKDMETLAEALRADRVDVAGATTVEYLAMEPEGFLGTVFGTTVEGTTTENYILIVRIDAEAKTAADLEGGDLQYLGNARTCLALPWLENLLRSEGLGNTSEFFGSVTSSSKVAKVVLPVFFGQADACMVTRKGFQMMAELNPQVGRELRVLAASPEVMPAVFVFRKNYDSPVLDDVLTGLRELHESAAGRQVLTVFQSERLVELPLSSMDSARRILAGHCDPESDGPGLGAATTKTDDESVASGGLR